MKKLVYIGEDTERSEQLKQILSDEYEFDAIERSEALNLDDCALVILEKRSDPGSNRRNMVRFESLLGFRDIPLVVCIDQTDLDHSPASLDHNNDQMLVSPFDDDHVREQIQKALTPVGTQPPPDDEVLDSIVEAARLVVGQIAGVDIVHTGSYHKKDYRQQSGICAMMPLTGYLEGSLGVGFSTLLTRRLSAQMAGCEEEFVTDEDLPDGVGEVVNQISGKVKTILSEKDKSVEIGLPEICQGTTGSCSENGALPITVLLFECASEPFAVYVRLRQNTDSLAEQQVSQTTA